MAGHGLKIALIKIICKPCLAIYRLMNFPYTDGNYFQVTFTYSHPLKCLIHWLENKESLQKVL